MSNASFRRIVTRLLLCGWLLSSLVSPSAADELKLDAHGLLDRAVTRNLRLSDQRDAIQLQRGVLYEDDGPAAGYTYGPNVEKLEPELVLKKELIIPRPEAAEATLLVGPGGELTVKINGKPARLQPLGKQGHYWQAYRFPPRLLRAGSNELLLAGAGSVWVARDQDYAAGSLERPRHPNRSAKSGDGGKTWNDARLGTGNDLDGEYYVRVFLDQFQPEGELTLGVIDVGNLSEKPVGPPVTQVGTVRIAADVQTGPNDSVTLLARTGDTYVPAPQHWSAWTELGGAAGEIARPRGRYLQLQLRFSSGDGLASPRLRGLSVSAAPTRPEDWTDRLEVRQLDNPTIVRSSIPFRYEPFERPELAELRRDHKLDAVVAGAETEFELIRRLAAWSATRWDRMHLKDAYPAYDALQILKPHADGTPVGGFCQQYNVVFLQACESFGLVGRLVSIGPGNRTDRIRGGHETAEIWSNDHRKWVYIDGNTAWYAVDSQSGAPLSLLELRERQLAAFDGRPHPSIDVIKLAETRHQWPDLTSWPPLIELRLIPRSNFLESHGPLPLNQGMRGWFWTGHYVWTDQQMPARPLYGNRIERPENFEWTLNQAHLALEAMGPGVLRVHIDTETPGFERLVRTDDEKSSPIEAVFDWRLSPGVNELEVRPQNTAGRQGIPAKIRLHWTPK